MTSFLGRERFDQNANAVFQYDPDKFNKMELTGGDFKSVLGLFIRKHLTEQVPRLEELKRYYLHDNAIHRRGAKSNPDQADNRIASAYAQYVTIFMQGYILGNPVKYENQNKDLTDKITDFNAVNHIDYHDSLIETDLSIYGRAYELICLDEQARERAIKLQPENTFVVYDNSVDPKPLFGVRYYPLGLADDIEYHVEVYAAKTKVTFTSKSSNYGALSGGMETAVEFTECQINEYQNNDDRIGDYENVLDNIDAYDLSQSELANFQQDSNDALLVIKGNPYTGTTTPEYQTDSDTGEYTRDHQGELIPIDNSETDVLTQMLKAHILVLDDNPNPDGAQPDAAWLIKSYDTDGSEKYKQRIVDDILRFTFTPDTNDQNFAGTQSGEAMKYKLLGNDNLRKVKERLLTAGFLRRLQIASNTWGVKGTAIAGIESTTVTFTPNLPEDKLQQITMATAIDGIASNETVLGLISDITGVDTKTELKRIKKQHEEAAAEFDTGYPDPNAQPKTEPEKVGDDNAKPAK